ncbi:LANO_0H02630g1_1 [Lachancea nothofagi CBS 11611]|uniref:DNA repair protein RAD5 n=1 Tax=Lachancea nothofagi CBS 11611 TaxID=1266666 RepID=A0A1G4KKZ5_9SACH|nr:LANO_0H02630g1_1 [Lachancea nothofagi CBS 11611]
MNGTDGEHEQSHERFAKKRFFSEELETNGDDLNEQLENQDSFLFQAPENGNVIGSDGPVEPQELQDMIPDLSGSQAEKLLARTDVDDDRNTRISSAVSLYFEQQRKPERTERKERVSPAVRLSNVLDSRSSSGQGKKIRDYGERLPKKVKPSVQWRRFIGSIQVSALATRPTIKPLKYGSELRITKSCGSEVSSKLYYANGRKRASMANFVRLFDVGLGREVGRVPEEVAKVLFPLVDSDELDFEATMIYCNNRRLSVGDSFIVQLDCFLTSALFDNFSDMLERGTDIFNGEKRGFTQNVVENEGELRMKARRLALLSLFDQVQLQPVVLRTESSPEHTPEATEVIDLDGIDGDQNLPEKDAIQPSQMQEDVLNVNQLKSLYKATLSMESSKHLPETEPNPEVFKLILRRYQKQGLTWLLRREREFDEMPNTSSSSEDIDGDMMNPLWKQFRWPKNLSWASQKINSIDLDSQSDEEFFYANLHTGEFSQAKPVLKSLLKGGILADEMGLGKTISILSMILTVPFDKKFCDMRTVEGAEATEDAPFDILQSQTLDRTKPYAAKTTLVIVPMSLLSQWQQEFEKSASGPDAHCEIYYGGNTGSLRTLLTKTKKPPMMLLTTYGTVQHEWSRLVNKSTGYLEYDTAGLFSVDFFRIVIDEGHTIRNRNTRTSKSLMDLSSSRRWILTGTPIINRLDDLYSLVKFMRLEPWSQVGYWKTFVSEPFEKKNYKSAFDVVSSILEPVILRRTKQMRDADGNRLVELPPKEVIIERVSFNKHEDVLYKYFLNRAENSVREGLDRGDLLKKYSTILVHILRLRQVCCHADLLGSQDENDEDLAGNKMLGETFSAEKAVSNETAATLAISESEADAIISNVRDKYPDEEQYRKLECSICTSEPIDPVTQVVFTECGHAFCEMCIIEYIRFQSERHQNIKCPNCRSEVDPKRLVAIKEMPNKELTLILYDTGSKSSKITSLMKSLKRLQDGCPGEQVVVFSQFSSFMDIMEKELSASFSKSELKVYKFDGRLSMKERSKVLQEFAEKDLTKLKVLLLSLKAGGVGLNLTCASRAYMMDPWWSPSLEDQAIDRIHRIGQVNDVKVVRFIMEHSIEEKMLRIQERKRTLGEAVDADEDERRKRRIEEIQTLFE